jgi:ribosomal protein L11 methylase PrmA
MMPSAAALLATLLASSSPQLSGQPDVPYVPTPAVVVERMLALAEVRSGDVVYDLGCGDGRIVIAAVRIDGVRGVCVEIDPALVREARANAEREGVADRIRFVQADLFRVPIADATVVTLYLLPQLNLRLRPRLLTELRPGTRIVSHGFDMGDWTPEQRVEVALSEQEGVLFPRYVLYRWTVPRSGEAADPR